MNRNNFILAALLSTLFVPALAADTDAATGPETRIVTREVRPLDATAFAAAGMRRNAKPVTNLPYSAEIIEERVQNLADGNQIVRKTTALVSRDSAGRTRQEIGDANGEVRTVMIHDVVSGATYILNPREKTATQIAPNKELGAAAAEAARARIEALRKEGKLPALTERREIIIKHSGNAEEEVRVEAGMNSALRIQAPNMQVGPGGHTMIQLGSLAGAFGDGKWMSKATTRELGMRDIEGIKAEGKMRSYEIPVGEVGNRNPITVSDETWTSPELQVTLLHKHSDPRSGENTYRLAGIKREEPAAALFAVPSDYKVKDVMANVQRMIEKRKP